MRNNNNCNDTKSSKNNNNYKGDKKMKNNNNNTNKNITNNKAGKIALFVIDMWDKFNEYSYRKDINNENVHRDFVNSFGSYKKCLSKCEYNILYNTAYATFYPCIFWDNVDSAEHQEALEVMRLIVTINTVKLYGMFMDNNKLN